MPNDHTQAQAGNQNIAAASNWPCPDCGCTDEGHATPCGVAMVADLDHERTGPNGKTAKQLVVQQLTRLLEDVRRGIDASESLCAVTALALRQMDCDQDGDCADVLEDEVNPHLVSARDALEGVLEIVETMEVPNA